MNLDGYTDREVANARANHPTLKSAAELERSTDAWDQPIAAPSPECAARLRAQGWTPINQDAAEGQLDGVASTTEATVLDPTQDTPTIGDRLHAIADWLDRNPAADPFEIALSGDTIVLQDYSCHTREDAATRIKALGGRWDKRDEDALIAFVSQIGPGVEYRIALWRSAVCEREQVGVRTVTEPDPDLLAALPTVTREEPVYEWRCAPVLAEGLLGEAA